MNKRVMLVLTFALLTLVHYQNCGKVAFSGIGRSPTAVAPETPGIVVTDPKNEEPRNTEIFEVDVVECMLAGPYQKITLSGTLELGSNSASTRVCMSSHSCLNLINDYAAMHNCSLSKGIATSANSQMKCTDIFPGSSGTCQNARILSDTELVNILANMAANK